MASQQVLVKSLQTIETFNSVSMICTDKTGTLTQNKMSCTHLLWDINEEYQIPTTTTTISQDKKEWKSIFGSLAKRFSLSSISRPTSPGNTLTIEDSLQTKRLEINQINLKCTPQRDLILGACLCNNAEKRLQENEQQLQVSGDAADVALYNLCENKFNIDVEHIRHHYSRIHCLPFNSTNKFMIVANQLSTKHQSILNNRSNQILITLKGATDVVLTREKCLTYKTNTGEIKELTDDIRQQIIQRQEQMGRNGYRIIAMLQQTIEKTRFEQMLTDKKYDEQYNSFPIDGYTFIGLFCLFDPPRIEVPDAVIKARQAKIRIAMVTGDHPTTAISIAKQVNILSPDISFDTFQLTGIDMTSGRPIVQLIRNGNLLDTHILGSITRLEETKKKTNKIQLINDDNKLSVSWIKRIWEYINFYFSDPKQINDRDKKQILIPYAIVVKGNDIAYSMY
jgi:sodium/potassium-transporting ATPase subunit alpha